MIPTAGWCYKAGASGCSCGQILRAHNRRIAEPLCFERNIPPELINPTAWLNCKNDFSTSPSADSLSYLKPFSPAFLNLFFFASFHILQLQAPLKFFRTTRDNSKQTTGKPHFLQKTQHALSGGTLENSLFSFLPHQTPFYGMVHCQAELMQLHCLDYPLSLFFPSSLAVGRSLPFITVR